MEKKMLVAELGRLGISVVEGEFVRKSEIRTVLASFMILTDRIKPFYSDCVSWPLDTDVLDEIRRNGDDVERDDFLAQVNFSELGNPDELVPADDWAIRYYKYEKGDIYFFIHSGIEHIFADDSDIRKVAEKIASEYDNA
jgi:hypothetical protein